MANLSARPLSLVRLSFLAVAVFALCSMLVAAALGSVKSSSENAVASWRQFSDQASAQQRALRAFVTQAGIAGLIEDYHRLAATGEESLLPVVYGRAGAALAALATYPIMNVPEEETIARATLQAVVRAYAARIGPVVAMHREGQPAAAIFAAADVNGTAALPALEALADATAHSMLNGGAPIDSKALILLDTRRLLGLEGLVHNANRYLAGVSPDALERVHQDVAKLDDTLERYRRHYLAPEEAIAVQALADELHRVTQQLRANKAVGAVIFDASPLQAALLKVEMLVYAEAMTAQTNLQSTLDEVSSRAGVIMVVVAVGALILIACAIWFLVFRVGRRINAITRTMRDLASGNLDARIPATGDHDEIGDMSRALLVFRDGLRANATLTTELAESSRLASLGAMVAGMAHELNTPIGNALAVSSTLEDQCKNFRKDLNSERLLRSALDRHATSLEDASTLIQRNLLRAAEQIGSFKQVAVDQTSGKRREFPLDDVLANVVHSMQPQFKRTPFSLTMGEASGVVMESYPGALSQVITNLVENGLRHGLAGRATGKVEVRVRRADSTSTEIVVQDDGAGIPDEVAPDIFNAFFTTKAGKGGSGLGLHIVKAIVCGSLGGRITVESHPGEGSRFIITLPNKAPADTVAAETTERQYYAIAQHAA